MEEAMEIGAKVRDIKELTKALPWILQIIVLCGLIYILNYSNFILMHLHLRILTKKNKY